MDHFEEKLARARDLERARRRAEAAERERRRQRRPVQQHYETLDGVFMRRKV